MDAILCRDSLIYATYRKAQRGLSAVQATSCKGQTITGSIYLLCLKSVVVNVDQCDEARPACAKCVKAKRVCSGYSEGLDLVLRTQNDAAKAAVDRRVHKNKSRSQTPENTFERQPSTAVAVPYPLYEPEETNALCFFVSTFVLYGRDTQADRGFIEHLPFLFNRLRAESPLSLCLAAASNIVFGKWERKTFGAERYAFPSYTKALKATRVALQDPIESVADETLMAVCLLGFYEVLPNNPNAVSEIPVVFTALSDRCNTRLCH